MQKHLFPELGIAPELLKAIESLGFEQPSPIQSEAIPVALQGRDVVGQSQTGSGKTMAFGIPALQRIDPEIRAVQVLVLCPTRELAMQVCAELHKLAAFKPGVSATPIYGGASYDRQIRGIKQGSQIVVGTPGRILDFLKRGLLSLDQLRLLVFDEADEMLDMGFREDIERLMESVPAERQTIFFSATMAPPIRRLITQYTRDPATITIEHKALTVPTVEQRYYEVRGRSKVEVLCRVLDIESARLAIVFANTKRAVDEITDDLIARGYAADRLHGDLSQAMRDRVMRNFRNRSVEVLVATDVAARGLDVNDVDIIFNFDLPYDEEDYVHRIGRTGRAGRSGRAVSLVAGREIFLLQRIQRFTKSRIQHCKVPSQEEVENTRMDQFFEKLKQTLESGEFAPHDHTIQRLLDAGFGSTDISSALLHLLLQSSARQGEAIAEDRSLPSPVPKTKSKTPPATARDDVPANVAPAVAAVPAIPAVPAPAASPVSASPPPSFAAQEIHPPAKPRRKKDLAPSFPSEFETAAPARKKSPRPERGREKMVRMFINVGSMDDVRPAQITGALYKGANLPAGSVGPIEIFERSSYVGIPENLVEQAISGVAGVKLRGRALRMDVADRPEGPAFKPAFKPFFKKPAAAGGFKKKAHPGKRRR